MSRTITLIPGDGIGPEVTAATVRMLEAAGAGFEWESHIAGGEAVALTGTPLPPERARFDPAHQGGAQGSGDHAGRHRLQVDQRADCARTSTSTPTCARRVRSPAFRPASRTSTW